MNLFDILEFKWITQDSHQRLVRCRKVRHFILKLYNILPSTIRIINIASKIRIHHLPNQTNAGCRFAKGHWGGLLEIEVYFGRSNYVELFQGFVIFCEVKECWKSTDKVANVRVCYIIDVSVSRGDGNFQTSHTFGGSWYEQILSSYIAEGLSRVSKAFGEG